MKAWLIVTIFALGSSTCADQSLADRTVIQFAAAGMPIQRAVGRLAFSQGLCMGSEIFHRKATTAILPSETRSAHDTVVSVSCQSRTLRQIMDEMISQAPTFYCLMNGEWINLGLRDQMTDSDNPLNWRIPGQVCLNSASIKQESPLELREWLQKMNLKFALRGSFMTLKQSIDIAPQSIVLENPTLREYLNCANRLRGKTFWFVVVEPRPLGGWTLWESFGVLTDDSKRTTAQ